jgi:nitrogen fixation protein NifU and related proteins
MTLQYNKKVMKLFMNPKNMGEIKDADGIGKVGNPVCGDVMWVYIKVGKNSKGKEVLTNVKFKTFGCASAIATSSMITQIAKGKTIEEAKKIKYKDVVDSLGGLPQIKIHCSTLATEALNKAIENYKKNKRENKKGKIKK